MVSRLASPLILPGHIYSEQFILSIQTVPALLRLIGRIDKHVSKPLYTAIVADTPKLRVLVLKIFCAQMHVNRLWYVI